jgi:bacillithiol synthase
MKIPLDCYPGMNRFVLDWIGGDTRFLPRETQASSLPVRRLPGGNLVDALKASNRHWGIFPDLGAWSRGESFTIIAGQQVGFAGGPLYTLAKLASLVKMKRALGRPATLFFWLATEDHDFDEVSTLNVPVSTLPREKDVNRQLDLVCMRAVRTTDWRRIVGPQPVPETLITQLLALFDIPRPPWLREGISFRDSFAELVASIFGNEIVLVDALLPELRRAGAPLFEQIHARHGEIQQALSKRSDELEAAGYQEQVVPRDGTEYTLLFRVDEQGHRQPATSNQQPEQTSTSALTRPLLQDFVFQPDVFVGGPAEVAYYAQIAPLHDLLGAPMPSVALRGHALVAPRRITRALSRYGFDPAEIFRSADELLAEREPEGVARIRSIAEEGKRELLARVEEIGELALPADHSLAGSIQRSIGHLEFHWDKLAERAIKGLVRKDRERYQATRELVATLYPDRHVQDRVVSWFAYWCAHGNTLVERMIDEIEPNAPVVSVVEV